MKAFPPGGPKLSARGHAPVGGRVSAPLEKRFPRSFLKTCSAAGLGALAVSCLAPEGGTPPELRPNILLIYTDDQRYDALGVVQKEQGEGGRFPWLSTPNLDRLAREGVRFRQSFVVNSICSPSRACTLTGTYSHVNGIKDNGTELPAHNVTVGTLLQQAGYSTGYFGKWHMGRQATRPGFDVWASQLGHGWLTDCDLNINGKMVKTEGWLDDVVTDHAMDYMRTSRSKPFFAVVGYKAPHTPYDHHEGETRQYDAVAARSVPSLGKLPAFSKTGTTERQPYDATQTTRDYFRMLDNTDRNIGRILEMLDREGLASNTVVVFTSDNGYFLGEHGVNDKRLAYEESLRVPLLVRWPGHVPAGRTSEALSLNIDLAPTFLQLAGATVPAHLQGKSLAPVLADPSKELRESFFYEYFREKPTHLQPTLFAVRTRTEKLIHYPETPAEDELFDLVADPYELANQRNNPAQAATRARLTDLLVAEASRLGLPRDELRIAGRQP